MSIPYNIITNISLFIESKDDLYNFLQAFNLEDKYNDICNFICNYYINELLPNEEIEYFLEIEELPEGAYLDEIFPEDNTNEYKIWCSKMVKIYI